MRASSTSWKRLPLTDGVALRYESVFNAQQFSRLVEGLVPHVMEDKWFIYYDEPHLFLHRSWTGQPVYRVKLKHSADGVEVEEALWSKELAEASSADVQYQSQLIEFLIANLLLGEDKPFPRQPGLEDAKQKLLQHAISGTGYRISPAKTGKQ
jgi:hypothetical protein